MDANANLVFGNFLIVENILRYIPSKDLLKARLINNTFDWLGKIEILERGDHVIHFANGEEMNQFTEFLDKNYPDLDQWSPYSFKIPIGDIDRNVLDKFVALVGSRIKILDLYEAYSPKRILRKTEGEPHIRTNLVYSQDRTNFANIAVGRPFPGDYAQFLNVTRTMPKIWHLLNQSSASLLELSLSLCTEFVLISGRFPERLPYFDRLKKLNVKYEAFIYRAEYNHLGEFENSLDWNQIWGGHRDDKLFKNIVERAPNMTNGHIITPYYGHSRILTEIGSIQFANGGKPSLETTVNFSSLQTPIIRNLMQQQFFNRVNVLEVRLKKYSNFPRIATTEAFVELLRTLHDFIVSQSQSLRILSIDVDKYGILTPIPNFTTVRPMQPFSKLEVLELKPNEGESYKFLKQFFKGDFPILKEFHPFYDINDVTYIEAPNVTMPQELLEEIRKSFDNQKDNTRYFLFACFLIAIAILL